MKFYEEPKYQAYMADQIADTLGAGVDDKYLDYLTQKLLPNYDYAKAKILDVGPSKFMSWDYFREKFKNDITGIDIGKDGLEFCKAHNKTGMIEMDAHRMDEHFAEGVFDLLISFHAFEHMIDLPRVLTNCHKVLKTGGLLYFAQPIPSFNWGRGHWYDVPSVEVMMKLISDAGFKTVLRSEFVRDLRFRPEQEIVALVQK